MNMSELINVPVYKLRKHIRIMKARMNYHKSIGGKVGYFQNQIKITEKKLLKLANDAYYKKGV